MNRKIKELLKSLAIILLAANAVFLAYRSGVFNEFLAEAGMPGRLFGYWGKNDFQGNDGNGAYESSGDEVIARPVIMAVVGDIGARCGAKYNQEQLDAMYQKTVNIFGEALGSATMPEECTEDEWRTALNMPGVYWDYQVELPIVSLVKWLGMSALNNNTDYASRFVAVIGERGVDVYYANEEGFYKCASAADADSIGSVMQEFLPNGAYFAFESEEVSGMVAPYTLLMPNISDKYVIEAENLLSREGVRESTAELLGMNILGGASYPEKNGTMVYVGVNGILRIHADGELNYSVTDYAGLEDSDVVKDENGRCTVSFGYYADGTMIVHKSGKAATVVYENGRMVSVDIWMRSYRMSGDKATLLPERQAAAIAGGLEKNGNLLLAYYDEGSRLEPVWTVE